MWDAVRLSRPLVFPDRRLSACACRSRAFTNSSFLMECQPDTFFFLAIEARSLTVRFFNSAAVIATLISAVSASRA